MKYPLSRRHYALLTSCALFFAMATGMSSAQTTTHSIKTVWLIVMENHNWNSIKGSSSAPYINHTLLPMASHAESDYNPPGIHPSLPNYLWLEAGSSFGVHDDGPPSQHSQTTTKHLVTLLHNAGIPWKSYDEDISGTNCPILDEGPKDSNGSALYAVKHNPFAYFNDVTGYLNLKDSYCIAHVRPFTEMQSDLNANHVARYNFITPNLCDDMHDSCGGNAIAHGDAWLSKTVPKIMNSAAYRNGGLILITWDEGEGGDGPVGLIALSPEAKGHGYQNYIHYTHGSTLRTLEEIFGVSPILRYASAVPDLRDLFRVFP